MNYRELLTSEGESEQPADTSRILRHKRMEGYNNEHETRLQVSMNCSEKI